MLQAIAIHLQFFEIKEPTNVLIQNLLNAVVANIKFGHISAAVQQGEVSAVASVEIQADQVRGIVEYGVVVSVEIVLAQVQDF